MAMSAAEASARQSPALIRRLLDAAWLKPFAMLALMVVLWDLAIWAFNVPAYLIPRPWDVVKAFGTDGPMLLRESIPTTIATLGTPQDVTLQEVRIECFFPADDRSDALFRSLAAKD